MLWLRLRSAVGLGALSGLLLTSIPVLAHHSTAMYNMDKPVTVTGVVKRFEWTNPHAFVFLEVKDEKGKTVEWEVEMMSLNHLRGYGWTRDTVKPGDVDLLYRRRSKKRRAFDDQLLYEDGRRPDDEVLERSAL